MECHIEGSKIFLKILVSRRVFRFSFFANIFPCICDVHFSYIFNFGNWNFLFLGFLDTFRVSFVDKIQDEVWDQKKEFFWGN
jgi:hypothetical protein